MEDTIIEDIFTKKLDVVTHAILTIAEPTATPPAVAAICPISEGPADVAAPAPVPAPAPAPGGGGGGAAGLAGGGGGGALVGEDLKIITSNDAIITVPWKLKMNCNIKVAQFWSKVLI